MIPSRPPKSIRNLVELLQWRGENAPPTRGFRFLENGEGDGELMSFARLDERARALGAKLQEVVEPGERVLLLFPPSLEYVEAFFGALYAGAIAVPAYPPNPSRLNRTLPRLQAIVEDAGAKVALTTSMIASMAEFLGDQAPQLKELKWVATDLIDDDRAGDWSAVKPRGEDVAFLQYTSGSTGMPKGVVLDHATLMRNEELIQEVFGARSDDVGVSWLPLYHDMGLLGAVIQPVYCGFESVLMSPLDFLKRPRRWVEAISKQGGTLSTAPNFAYDLAVRKTPEEVRDGLDLSKWRVACNGAEPVREETMRRFTEYFGSCGFEHRAFSPSYGLAEVGLIVSGTASSEEPRVVDREGKEEVSSGRPLGDFEVKIVEEKTKRVMKEGEVGELWLRGGSVARGYWQKEEVNREVFQAYLADGQGPYLRTGDLGYLIEGDVVVTGRLKDLVVIRGENHYPQDIEATVEKVDRALRPGCGAAFSVEIEGGEEGLVVVQEVNGEEVKDEGALLGAIVEAVVRDHEVAPYEVVLIEARTIEKTSSGKIQRFAAREAYLGGGLAVVVRTRKGAVEVEGKSKEGEEIEKNSGGKKEGEEEIIAWLVKKVAQEGGWREEEVDSGRSFSAFGIDSAAAVGIVGELEEWLGRSLEATALYDFPTIGALAGHLSGKGGEQEGGEMRWTKKERGRQKEKALAIVGMACRFPGAADLEAYEKLLMSGESALGVVPSSRWEPGTFTDPEIAGFDTIASDRGGFLEDIEGFDRSFFGISVGEARAMDPQQRLVMETAWTALEDGGLSREALSGSRTGVFIGQSGGDFARLYQGAPVRAASGMAPSITANRISYWLNLRGPSMAIDTACSSSLVALEQAMLQVRAGRCEQAIVGGVNVILAPDMSQAFSQAGMLSPTGECRTFDEGANGYVRGEGCGVVVVKALEDALEAGDRIWAVIRGGAVNQDGATNGLTAPSGEAQRAVIRAALEDGAVATSEIGALEAHGTGTELGDAIEVRALRGVFGEEKEIWLGSVKSQIGHLEAGAGMAGLIKAALMARGRRATPQVAFAEPNRACKFEESPFKIPAKEEDFLGMVGVSSFGFGGTNAHFIVDGPPTEKKIGFAFTGQGSQEPGMGMRLREELPLFQKHYDEALEAVIGAGARDLRAAIGGDLIDRTGYAQPAIFALEVGLGKTLMELGVKPAVMMGHSVGEFAAAHLGGALSLEEAAGLVVARGELMEALAVAGAMAAVFEAPEVVEEAIRAGGYQRLEIGVYNGERHVVVSGDEEELAALVERLDREGIFAKELKVSHGFHSALMEPMLEKFGEVAREVRPKALRVPMVSALRAGVIEGEELDGAYWTEHIRRPVRFVEAAREMERLGVEVVVEVGPKAILTALGARLHRSEGPAWVGVLREGSEGREEFVSALAGILRQSQNQRGGRGREWNRERCWPREGDLRRQIAGEEK